MRWEGLGCISGLRALVLEDPKEEEWLREPIQTGVLEVNGHDAGGGAKALGLAVTDEIGERAMCDLDVVVEEADPRGRDPFDARYPGAAET
jgi:hypothetical protein